MKRMADYALVRSLGQGNHGEFFLAVPPDRLGLDTEHVALKVMGQNASDDAFRRVANELKLFASVSSPHLVRLFDAGHQGGLLYYAMEYFPDGSLGVPSTPIEREHIVRAVADAARAAHALHEVGVAHRDIKPTNIMVHDNGGKLSDLGLAQILSPGQTTTGIGPVGAIQYMEPEVIRGEKAVRASDVWALGVTLHTTLAGRSVYGEIPDQNLVAALRHVLDTPPTISDDLDDEEAALVRECLAAERSERPPTALAVAERLEALLESS